MAVLSRIHAVLNEPEGLSYHGLAVLYAVLGYALGLAGLFADQWPVNGVAVLLLAHAMVIAAYLVHECGHNLVFHNIRHNAMLGRALTWICGASYGTYEDIRYKHFRHHVDVDDVVWFDYERYFREHPAVLRITRVLDAGAVAPQRRGRVALEEVELAELDLLLEELELEPVLVARGAEGEQCRHTAARHSTAAGSCVMLARP